MTDEEIQRRIDTLTVRSRMKLYKICRVRKDRKLGPEVADFVPVSDEVADELERSGLVWRFFSTVAARHDVYDYWDDHIRKDEAA